MNNLKIAFRNVKRDKFYAVINIAGLAIGMAATILILTWVWNEWSYDRFHSKEKQLHTVWSRIQSNGLIECWNRTSVLMGPALKSDYPDVVEMTRFLADGVLYSVDDIHLKMQTGWADPGFLTMFSFPLLQGNPQSALNDNHSIILTEKAAKRLFGNENPMGRTITIPDEEPATVTGVVKDLPKNTTFDFDVLRPYALVEKYRVQSWNNYTVSTYVELQPQAKDNQLNQLIVDIFKKNTDNKVNSEAFLFPLSQSHLYTKSENGKLTGGLIDTLRLFSLIALLILLIACINFMNLSTARSEKRAREVGVRKVMGGKRIALVRQFLGESITMAFIAGLIALLIVMITFPVFSSIMGKPLTLDIKNGWFWVAISAFILFTGVLAGIYPAFYLSSFTPEKVLKGTYKIERNLVAFRKILIVFQFFIAISLVFVTLIIHRQLYYAQSRDNGYNKEALIYHRIEGDIDKNYDLIKHELLESGVAASVTRTYAPMTQHWANATGVKWRGNEPDDQTPIDIFIVDSDWTKTVGTTVINGRDINVTTYPTDETAALLNEAAVKIMNLENPIGEEIQYWGFDFHVVGVLKNFILHSPYDPIPPMIISGKNAWTAFSIVYIRLNTANKISDSLAKAGQIFKKYNPNYPFDYTFADEEYSMKFQEEQQLGTLANWFAGLTIFISCLGLFALVGYMAETRKKEIGIRKVFGASINDVISLLSKEFLVLVLVSILIAAPVAWWAMNKWLNEYACHTDIPWWIFIIVGLTSLLIAILTVSYQAVKAATANPVKAIKTE